MPDSKDRHRQTARSKGKVERAFRTVKEAHEVLYHLREPQNEVEANERLLTFLTSYNDRPHRIESHSRMEDWIANAPAGGIRKMCSWERFCTFAREPEQRKVGIDARISVEGATYEVSAELAGETVILWWGLFDRELYVEYQDQRFGPYIPISGLVPLHRYQRRAKTTCEIQQDKIETLADALVLATHDSEHQAEILQFSLSAPRSRQFDDPDPFQEFTYPTILKAKQDIADYLGKPLAALSQTQRDWINALLEETLDKAAIRTRVRDYFITNKEGKEDHVTL